MQLECKDGVVLSYFEDGQSVSPREGAMLLPWSKTLEELPRFGELRSDWPEWADDPRPYAAPALAEKSDLAAYANARQWWLATGGYTFTIGGAPVLFGTDEVSQSLMAGKVARLDKPNPPTSFNWQTGAGFITIPAADFEAAAIMIADFVQATFDTLKTVLAGIASGSVKTLTDVDAAGWPANTAAGG